MGRLGRAGTSGDDPLVRTGPASLRSGMMARAVRFSGSGERISALNFVSRLRATRQWLGWSGYDIRS